MAEHRLAISAELGVNVEYDLGGIKLGRQRELDWCAEYVSCSRLRV